MLDVRSSTPALSTQFTTKNYLKLDVLLNQTTRPDLLQSAQHRNDRNARQAFAFQMPNNYGFFGRAIATPL